MRSEKGVKPCRSAKRTLTSATSPPRLGARRVVDEGLCNVGREVLAKEAVDLAVQIGHQEALREGVALGFLEVSGSKSGA